MDTTQDRTRVGRRERPSKAALSRESIVLAALDLLDKGVERLTMRRVAAELDTGPASLYVYVRDAEELHAAVLEELLGTSGLLDVGRDSGRGWRPDIIELLRRYSALLLAYPAVARVTAFTRPVGPNYIHLAERLLALMVDGGVSLREAAWGVDLLLQQAETTAAEQGIREAQGQEADDLALRTAISSIVAANSPDLPHVVAAGEDLISGEGSERGIWAFEVLLNGLLTTPRPETVSSPEAAPEPEAPPPQR